MKSVAIVGEMASGKTTLANVLVDHHGYTRVGFATRLKEMASSIYGHIGKGDLYSVVGVNTGEAEEITGREVLQRLGQSVKALDRDLWVKWLVSDIEDGRYGHGPFVIDDCRFPYEAEALRAEGFRIARIYTPEAVRMDRYEMNYGHRPNISELSHPSESEVRNITPDAVFDGTDLVRDLTVGLLALLREEDDLS